MNLLITQNNMDIRIELFVKLDMLKLRNTTISCQKNDASKRIILLEAIRIKNLVSYN